MESSKTAEKLKSALRQTHWSLALRAAVFGASWLFLPFWVFMLVALYFYFIPFFQPWILAFPSLVLIFFTAVLAPSLWLAVFFGVTWYLILGIKDLIFVGRKQAYEMLVFLLVFLITVGFFSYFDSWAGTLPMIYSLTMSAVIFLLSRGFLNYGADSPGSAGHREKSAKNTIAAGVVALVLFELSLPFLVLPLHFLYQASLFFVVSVILMESAFEYAKGTLTRQVLLVNFSIFFIFLVIILGSAQWTL